MRGIDVPQDRGVSRPDWDSYFLALAFVASRRSMDPSTKHGAVLVDANRHVLSMGFNSFPAGMDDASLPLCRPSQTVAWHESKYPWMDHAEVNAIANAATSLWSAAGPVTAYVTGTPCFACSKSLCRSGILNWVVAERRGFTEPPPGELENTLRLARERGVVITRVRPDLGFLVGPHFLRELADLGFIEHDFATKYLMMGGT